MSMANLFLMAWIFLSWQFPACVFYVFENKNVMLKLRLPVLHPETTSGVDMPV